MTAWIRIAGGRADLSQQILVIGDERTRLTTKERDLLAYLTANPGRTITRGELLVQVWAYPANASDEPVYSAVKRLRAKIDRGAHQHIVSVHGDGYRWAPPVAGPGEDLDAGGPSVSTRALPATVNRFFGRLAELTAIEQAFAAGAALVTLVGPGGAGKTRCALEAARATPHVFCDLSSATPALQSGHASSVIGLIAAALQVPLDGQGPSERVVSVGRAIAAARARTLILDNCEGVIDDVAALAAAWLPCSPRLLATSREPLRVRGERVISLGALGPTEAVQLFADRVVTAGGDPGDADLQARIVGRVDRLPLAIELAAAQVPELGGEALFQSLDALLATLVVGARDAPARHATLRAAVEWSWTLLQDRERQVLGELSVFAGTFSIDAARAVVTGADAIAVLANLTRRCQLRREGDRFTLYAAVRELARERAGRQVDARSRHARHYREASEGAAALLDGPRHRDGAATLRADLAELRVAYAAASAPADRARLALTIDLALGLQAEKASSRRELLAEARAALAAIDGEETTALVVALLLAEGRIEGAPLALLDEAKRRAVDPSTTAEILLAIGERLALASLAAAEETLESARGLARPRSALAGRVLARLGEVYWARGLVKEASERLREALAIHTEVGDKRALARTSALLAHVDRLETGSGAATVLLERAEAAANELGEPRVRARVLTDLGQHRTRIGDQAGARAALDEAAALYASVGLSRERALLELHIAETLVGLGEFDRALEAALQAHAAVSAEGEVGLSTVAEAIGCIQLLRHDLEAAERSIDEGLRLAEKTSAARSFCTLLGKRGLLHLVRGELDRAWSDFDTAARKNEERGAITIAAASLADRSMASFAQGNADEGARDLAAARARLRNPSPASREGKMLEVCAIVGEGFAAIARGEPRAAVLARARRDAAPIFEGVARLEWDVVLRLSEWLIESLGSPPNARSAGGE
jgi:DNA-binding winged helix-turn-helix (wHTH) protein/tetratricopeptide (TPR) repeat protein